MKGKGSTCKEVIVRRDKVEKALMWLSKNNPLYKNIKIDKDALNSLPLNGIPCDISRLQETNSEVDQNLHLSGSNSDSDSDAESNVVYQKDTQTSSFLSFQQNEKHEHEIIKDKLAEKTISWPPILSNNGISNIASRWKKRSNFPNLNRNVPFNSAIKHLLKFGQFKNGQWNYRFEFLVSKETVVLRRWERSKQKFGFIK